MHADGHVDRQGNQQMMLIHVHVCWTLFAHTSVLVSTNHTVESYLKIVVLEIWHVFNTTTISMAIGEACPNLSKAHTYFILCDYVYDYANKCKYINKYMYSVVLD